MAGKRTRRTGKVKWFDTRRGFGFIVSPSENQDIFVHFSAIQDEGFRCLKDGEEVTFDLNETPKGLQAVAVQRNPRYARRSTARRAAAKPGPKPK